MDTVHRCLEAIPDASLLQGLRQARGHGRDDYPVSVLWGVAVLTPLLRHPSYDGCLAELRRNPTLCRLLGVETEAQIPHHWNLSRFLDVLGHPAHLAAMRVSFDAMVRRLASVVPDLGRRTAGDATALNARRGEAARQQAEVKLGLPQPGGGRKEYLDAEGKVERVVEWFGYKLHLLVDVRHELALAYWITEPAVGDNQMIAALLEQARQPAGGPDRIAGRRQGGRRRGRASVVAQGRDQAIDREPRVVEGRARANAAGTHGAFEPGVRRIRDDPLL